MTESQSINQSSKPLNSKKLPKWCKFLILALPVVISIFQVRSLDNDFFFLYSTGDYIVKHGFPYTDMLSMHSSMKIVAQQWLSSVIFYSSYNFLGEFGPLIILYAINVLMLFLTYRLISLITKNEIISASFAALINILIFDPFMVTRPQIFTYVILLAEVCMLEKYVQTNKVKYLIGIPALSLLLINLHAAMWPMLLVIMLPYIISAVPLHTKSVNHDATGDLIMILAIFIVCIVVGLLNPYGFDNMIYLTKSYGKDNFNVIAEMKPTNIGVAEGKTFFAVLAVVFLIIFFIRKKAFAVRYFLLFTGTVLLGMMQIKGIPYGMLFGVPAFTYLIKDFDITVILEKLKKIITKRIKVLIIIFLCCAVVLMCEGRFLTTSDIKMKNTAHYSKLYDIVGILNESEEPVYLYANFNDGQYFEFFGYHPYIDGRAELFLESNNKEYDYFNEYLLMLNGGYYYRNFVDKYQFNYLVVSKSLDTYLCSSLMHDDDFEAVYDTDDIMLFVRK